ncbi:MAG: hypothetical protein JRN52_01925 [Nitrososphaerota archaeon]|nr:hypothetical protein [Nitrososphaerota archaeon]
MLFAMLVGKLMAAASGLFLYHSKSVSLSLQSIGVLFSGTLSFISLRLISVQLIIGILAIGLLFFIEVSDQTYGRTPKLVAQVRKALIPVCVVMMILLFVIVGIKIHDLLVARTV